MFKITVNNLVATIWRSDGRLGETINLPEGCTVETAVEVPDSDSPLGPGYSQITVLGFKETQQVAVDLPVVRDARFLVLTEHFHRARVPFRA